MGMQDLLKKSIVIVDLDGTVADCTHRLHFIEGHNRDYNAFFDAMIDDKPIYHIIDLVRTLYHSGEYTILIVTGRPVTHFKEIEYWLKDEHVPYHAIFMRPENDFRKDTIIKKEILDTIRATYGEPHFALDDRSSVVQMWRDNGVPCLQVAPGDFDVPKYANNPGKLILLVGPSGAGKSTHVKNYTYKGYAYGNPNAVLSWTPSQVISTDDIREELCGDFQDQTRNDQVFVALHRLVKARIESGLLTVVDATNIRNADRKAFLDMVPKNTIIEYHIIDRKLDEKMATGGWRLKVENKGVGLIERHDQTFKSNLKDILAGDNDKRVKVIDFRKYK